MALLARLLERTESTVYALVRAADDDRAAARIRGAMATLFGRPDAYESRVVAVPADIERPGLGIDRSRYQWLAERTDQIVHSAASVSFSLPLAESREINVCGTERMLELASRADRAGGLERFSYVSTAYVAGAHAGKFAEHELDIGQRFRNPYEQSKFEAERLVRAHGGELPVEIFRPSIVVGESTSGWTASFNVLYTPIKAFVRGLLPALPARRSAPVDVVPVDFVADAVLALSQEPLTEMQTYHLVAAERATTVGRLIELCAGYLDRSPPIVIPPQLYTGVVYPILTRAGKKKIRQGLQRSKVFFPYFSMEVEYENDRTRRRLEPLGIDVPPIESYLPTLLDFAAESEWGRKSVSRSDALQNEAATGRALAAA
jgi:long-chain acyl-CoA synthetase